MVINQNSKAKWLLTVSLVFMLVLSAVGTVNAAEFPKGETILANETIDDDVFISGENVVIDGIVNGIVFAGGETVTLNGTVNGDAFLFGETIIVSNSAVINGNLVVIGTNNSMNGSVSGSFFSGSMAMVFEKDAAVGRNFYFGGFSLTAEEGSVVGKDLLSGAYQNILSGEIVRDLKVGAEAVELNGSIGGNAVIEVGDSSARDIEDSMAGMQFNPYLNQYVPVIVEPGLRVSDSASVAGKLTYTSLINQTSALEKIASGTVIYKTPVPEDADNAHLNYSASEVQPFSRNSRSFVWRTAAMSAARNFIKLMALGALALWLLGKPFTKVVDAAYKEPLKAMGWGFVVIAVGFLSTLILPLVFIMVGVIISFVSLGSLSYVWFGLVGLAYLLISALFIFTVFTLSKLITAYMFGKWIMKAVFKETEEKAWLNLLIGVFLFIIIRAIPFIGWIAALAAIMIGTGAFWLAVTTEKK